MMRLIPNWQDQDLTCDFCGSKKSVKYKTTMTVVDSITGEKILETEVCVCNKCVTLPVLQGTKHE